ncbi:hypothetical protein KFL_001090110 [Klebsormidium nitens]|uniref:Uncharacterized protein n=1 Tax=Klebsormidium nitens TaxID=105231 RepID=A0A1Y1HX58_KLENI|nr:hypothetical protein KFL_001090110 [Klebsormidium nitens]|eukprot:GAQ82362.1 hypothetical protein KFL_001090110 [Klebsormidium nitens]
MAPADRSASSILWAAVLVACCILPCAHASCSAARASRKLLQLDPSVCPYELGFTPCFSADGSSLNCVLDGCDGHVSIPGSPANQPQGVRDAGNVLVTFFTAIGNNDYALYTTAVERGATYHPDIINRPPVLADGQTERVFDELRAALQIPAGSDYRSIFKVTDAGIALSRGVVVGVGLQADYPSVNPTLTFYFDVRVTSATLPGFQIVDFYFTPFGAR